MSSILLMPLQDISGANTPTFDRQSDMVITPHKAADTVTSNLAAGHSADGTTTEAGKGELNHAATWDDFPNGRFGDFKSPAFGELNPWGTSTISVCFSGLQRSIYSDKSVL